MTRVFSFFSALLLTAFAYGECFRLEPGRESLLFTGTQAGAPVTGEFRRFRGFLSVDKADPGQGFLWVAVDVASLETQLPELNELLKGPEFFHAERWPEARFYSSSLANEGNGRYSADGELRIRDIERKKKVTFEISDGHLRGQGALQRLDYNVGTGQWQNTRWVGNEVTVAAKIPLTAVSKEKCRDPHRL